MKIRYTIMEAQRFATYALAGAAIDAEDNNDMYIFRFISLGSGVIVSIYSASKHMGYL